MVVEGARGEFSVRVGDRVVAQKSPLRLSVRRRDPGPGPRGAAAVEPHYNRLALATSSSDTLTRELAAAVDGEVRFDAATRALYATDASVYQIAPLGVVVPRSVEDVVKTVRIAARHGVPITARGGGTSQAGQAIGAGLVVDTSKYLNRILAVDPGRRLARVEPGVVLDELNAALKPHDLRFAPDVSSASRATVGGMIANNSSGARSVVYGKTIDHVRELTVVLADGRVTTLRADERRRAGARRRRGWHRGRRLPRGSRLWRRRSRPRSIGASRRSSAASAATTWTPSSIRRRRWTSRG